MRRYTLRPPTTEDLRCGARWLFLIAAGHPAPFERDPDRTPLEVARGHLARIALTPAWRTRDRLREPLWPPQTPDTIHVWAAIGASDALSGNKKQDTPDPTGPHALAYTMAHEAVFGAYMTDPIANESTTLDIPKDGIHPELAAAWVRAAKNAPMLLRDATNESTGHYTSADGVASQARLTLANEGLLWSVVGDRLSPPAMRDSDIGSRSYVGDVSLDWMLVHVSGAVLRGTSTAAVVAMKATPHDKAVQAAKTFLSGNVLRGLLCFVREDKHSTDMRLDREDSQPPQRRDLCDPKTATAIGTLCGQIAQHVGRDDVDRMTVLRGALAKTGHEYNADIQGGRDITRGEALLVHPWLIADLKTYPTDDDQSAAGAP